MEKIKQKCKLNVTENTITQTFGVKEFSTLV